MLVDGLLSVVHITDDGMSILEPLEMTDTHVVVQIPHLSAFGLVLDYVKRFLNSLPINGQVLLFKRPPDIRHRILDVFVLQDNIPVHQVKLSAIWAISLNSSHSCFYKDDSHFTPFIKPLPVVIRIRINLTCKGFFLGSLSACISVCQGHL